MTEEDYRFSLPREIPELVEMLNRIRSHYTRILKKHGSKELNFTLDGKLVGDIGEAIAVELYGIKLNQQKGIDGFIPETGKTVQVKTTGIGRGPAFTDTKRADYLLFFDLDFEKGTGCVVFNGPEHYARSMLPETFNGQKSLTPNQIRKAASKVKPGEKIPLLKNRD